MLGQLLRDVRVSESFENQGLEHVGMPVRKSSKGEPPGKSLTVIWLVSQK